jgi:hypothetical protein
VTHGPSIGHCQLAAARPTLTTTRLVRTAAANHQVPAEPHFPIGWIHLKKPTRALYLRFIGSQNAQCARSVSRRLCVNQPTPSSAFVRPKKEGRQASSHCARDITDLLDLTGVMKSRLKRRRRAVRSFKCARPSSGVQSNFAVMPAAFSGSTAMGLGPRCRPSCGTFDSSTAPVLLRF